MKSQLKFWILVGSIAVLTACYALFIFLPAKNHIGITQDNIARTEKEIDQSIQRIRQTPELRKERDRIKATVDVLRDRILRPDSISSAVRQLNKLCSTFQVKLNMINFSTDSLMAKSRASGSGAYESFELPVLLEFEGRFLDIGMMMEQTNRLPFIISFTDFSLATQEKSDKLKCETRGCVRIAASKNSQITSR